MNIMAIGAHPDDIEILCAGTLALYAEAGRSVHMVVLGKGDCGSTSLPPDEIAAVREKEARAAAEVIGAELHWPAAGDVRISRDPEIHDKLVEIIRQAKPDLIIAHDPNDYMEDHRAASRLAEECSMTATLPNYPTKSPAHFKIVPIYLMDTLAGVGFQPTEYVDITRVIETKQRMLACHESQTKWLEAHDQVNVEDLMMVMARFRGFQAGVSYAEGFRPLLEWGRIAAARLLPQ